MKPTLVLEMGMEGGGLSVTASRHRQGRWRFFYDSCNSMLDLLEENLSPADPQARLFGETPGERSSTAVEPDPEGWGMSKTPHPLHSTARTTWTHSGNSSQALSPAQACAGTFRGGHEQPTMVEGEAPVCTSTPPSASNPLSRARLPGGL